MDKKALPNLATLKHYGIHGQNIKRVFDSKAKDSLVTLPNIGIPTEVLTYIDNQVVEVLTAKRTARMIAMEVKKGDATTSSAKFPMAEFFGVTEAYNDFSDGGTSGVNYNFENRDNYLFSTTRKYGDLEADISAKAKLSLVADGQRGAATIIDVDMNKFYMFGVAGLRNYGLTNDPSLPASITPIANPSGDLEWVDKTAQEIYDDVIFMFAELSDQAGANIDQNTKLVLAVSPKNNVALGKQNDLGNASVLDMLKRYFTNLEIVSAPEYAGTSDSITQMYAKEIDGEQTAWCAFSEKMYAFAPVRGTSYMQQKFRAGTYGAIIRRPFAVVTMLGA